MEIEANKSREKRGNLHENHSNINGEHPRFALSFSLDDEYLSFCVWIQNNNKSFSLFSLGSIKCIVWFKISLVRKYVDVVPNTKMCKTTAKRNGTIFRLSFRNGLFIMHRASCFSQCELLDKYIVNLYISFLHGYMVKLHSTSADTWIIEK